MNQLFRLESLKSFDFTKLCKQSNVLSRHPAHAFLHQYENAYVIILHSKCERRPCSNSSPYAVTDSVEELKHSFSLVQTFVCQVVYLLHAIAYLCLCHSLPPYSMFFLRVLPFYVNFV